MFLLLYICFISSYFPAINPESSSGETVLHPLGSPVPARPKLPAILCDTCYLRWYNLLILEITEKRAYFMQYVATLRELLEQLAKERNPDGLPRISKAKVNEYAENIEYVAAKLAVPTEDLTDEMVVLARQLKESSLMMNQSIKNTKKILDSTEKAVEHSLASTWHATSRAMDMYSRSFKTTCYQWLLIFVMVALLIRVTLQPTLCVTEDIIELLSFSIFL
ncbi:uncharacterized protein [Solanum lycopersicum]|uniref:uncharacterized protein isoform X2 n=1 Tax=Solanum lycopersicum TaxID=4081 RepID=UPI003748A5E4